MQALVRERVNDWGKGLCTRLGKKMVELTGDFTPDLRALLSADIIICTPEKWDGISRNWQNRTYVQKVGLLVIDEIHLLGADRSPTSSYMTMTMFVCLSVCWCVSTASHSQPCPVLLS